MRRLDDFMCVCSDEERAEAQACVARVLERLECDESGLLSNVVYGLEFGFSGDYRGRIDGIDCDQWALVSASVWTTAPGDARQIATVAVQCDLVEHGVARAWELAEEAVAEDESGSGSGRDDPGAERPPPNA